MGQAEKLISCQNKNNFCSVKLIGKLNCLLNHFGCPNFTFRQLKIMATET